MIMTHSQRCLFDDNIRSFIDREDKAVLGYLCERYHGDALTTTREAWQREIEVLQTVLLPWKESDGKIIFEYDIPRLGKRIDVVLLLQGIIICLDMDACVSKFLFLRMLQASYRYA